MHAQGEIRAQEPTGQGLNHRGLADGAARWGDPSRAPFAAEIGQLKVPGCRRASPPGHRSLQPPLGMLQFWQRGRFAHMWGN